MISNMSRNEIVDKPAAKIEADGKKDEPLSSLEIELALLSESKKTKSGKKARLMKGKQILGLKDKSPDQLNSAIARVLFSKILDTFKSSAEKKNESFEKKASYRIIEEQASVPSGGYGVVSKNYGALPVNSYADYNKLFSYLKDFKANSSIYSQNDVINQETSNQKDNFFFGDMQSMEKAVRHFKYFSPSSNIDSISMVPISGMSSGEWEDFKLWMKIDPVMYRLKTSTS